MENAAFHDVGEELDRLCELANVGAGHAATALARLVGRPIRMSVPRVRMGTASTGATPLAADDAWIFFEVQGAHGRRAGAATAVRGAPRARRRAGRRRRQRHRTRSPRCARSATSSPRTRSRRSPIWSARACCRRCRASSSTRPARRSRRGARARRVASASRRISSTTRASRTSSWCGFPRRFPAKQRADPSDTVRRRGSRSTARVARKRAARRGRTLAGARTPRASALRRHAARARRHASRAAPGSTGSRVWSGQDGARRSPRSCAPSATPASPVLVTRVEPADRRRGAARDPGRRTTTPPRGCSATGRARRRVARQGHRARGLGRHLGPRRSRPRRRASRATTAIRVETLHDVGVAGIHRLLASSRAAAPGARADRGGGHGGRAAVGGRRHGRQAGDRGADQRRLRRVVRRCRGAARHADELRVERVRGQHRQRIRGRPCRDAHQPPLSEGERGGTGAADPAPRRLLGHRGQHAARRAARSRPAEARARSRSRGSRRAASSSTCSACAAVRSTPTTSRCCCRSRDPVARACTGHGRVVHVPRSTTTSTIITAATSGARARAFVSRDPAADRRARSSCPVVRDRALAIFEALAAAEARGARHRRRGRALPRSRRGRRDRRRHRRRDRSASARHRARHLLAAAARATAR